MFRVTNTPKERCTAQLAAALAMATSIKDAIKLFETAEGKVAADCEDVRLCPISLQAPVIQKMDAALSGLKKCKHLRLSTNSIDKITGLNGMECLTILSLGRNQLRKIEGLDANCDTLEQLWVSYNQIGTLAGIEKLHNLEALPADGFFISCFPHKIRGASAGWTRAVAIFDDALN